MSKAEGNPGVICFSNLPFEPQSISVTPWSPFPTAVENRVVVGGTIGAVGAGCPASPDGGKAYVTGFNLATNAPAASVDSAYVWFEF